MRLFLGALGAGVLALLLGAPMAPAAAQTKTSLLVYFACEPEDLKLVKAAFERAHPDIELLFNRGSAEVVAARLLAERDNRQADMIWVWPPRA